MWSADSNNVGKERPTLRLRKGRTISTFSRNRLMQTRKNAQHNTAQDNGKAATTEGATGAQQVRFPLPLAKRWAILLMPSFRNTAVIRL
jgi:hypothetical protein